MSHVIVSQVIQLQLLILVNFQQYILNILTERMSKALKKEAKEVFKWTEALRKNLVESCLEAHARGNFTDSGFKSAEWSKIEERFNAISREMKANRLKSAIGKISPRVCFQA